jgi:hypothetical protein
MYCAGCGFWIGVRNLDAAEHEGWINTPMSHEWYCPKCAKKEREPKPLIAKTLTLKDSILEIESNEGSKIKIDLDKANIGTLFGLGQALMTAGNRRVNEKLNKAIKLAKEQDIDLDAFSAFLGEGETDDHR